MSSNSRRCSTRHFSSLDPLVFRIKTTPKVALAWYLEKKRLRNGYDGGEGVKFVMIFGPQAVGKMTVGHELEKVTDLKLFHNHMTIELLSPLFGFTPDMWRLSSLFRQEIFDAFAQSDQYGLIFTYVWAFELTSEWQYVEDLCRTFEARGAEVYFVELEADFDERLRRNTSPHRLEHKPSKRNVEQSEQNLRLTMENHRLNSVEGEIKRRNYMRIDNTDLSPQVVAGMIRDRFSL